MSESTSPVLVVGAQTALVILALALVLASIRLVRGPSLADRVVALDLIAFLVVALAGIYSVWTGSPRYLDVATVLAVLAFLSTIAFARYIEKGGSK